MFNIHKKNPKDKVVSFIKKNFSKGVSEILISNLKICFALDNVESREITIGTSKQAGFPDVPTDFIWPENNGKKLDFILQINLEEFEGKKIGLPEKGMLYFFLELKKLDFSYNKDQFKLIYIAKWDKLVRKPYERHNQVTEKPIKINESLTFPNDQSYLLMNEELSDEEFDALINLDYPIISELYGGGIYDIGKLAESSTIDEWVEIYNEENEKTLIAEESTMYFFEILSFMLDEWGYADSWVHIGIGKEELANQDFDKVQICFTHT